MKTFLFGFLIGLVFCVSALASPVVIDLSRSHTVDDLKKSGLVMREIGGGTDEHDFTFKNQEVEIRLPGGRSIRQKVKLGIIDTKDGFLNELSMSGDVMPHEQAVLVARSFNLSFGLPDDDLNQWNLHNLGQISDGNPYSISANLRFYPRVGMGIKPSMNALYPWVIRLVISWDWDKQRDWNEDRAWREFPASTNAAISFNPPSGQKYERRDAYKESLAAQAKLEQKLALKNWLKPWLWIIGAVFLLAVIVAILFKFRRKS